MHVAKDFLVGTHEEHADVVRFLFLLAMEWENMRNGLVCHEIRDFSIGVASDVLESAVVVRFLVQSVDWHDWEELVDGPGIRQRMEDGEIAEVLVCQEFVENAELLGSMLHGVRQRVDFVSYSPVHTFHFGTGAEVEHTVSEEVEGFFADLLGIVPVLQHGSSGKVVPDVVEVFSQLMVAFLDFEFIRHDRQFGCSQHFHDEHGMVGSQGASTLGDEVGLRNVVGFCHFRESIDTVVHVFLNGIVDATLGIRTAGTVVIHAQSTTAIDEFHVVTHLAELHIELGCFAECILNATNLRDLTADMEVNQLQAVLHAVLVDVVEGSKELTASETELAGIATTFFPFATTRSSQFDANTDIRTHVEVLGNLCDGFQLVQFLHHDKHALTHLLGKHSQFNVALVFIAVADDERVALHVHR